jgi:hypothetical protein
MKIDVQVEEFLLSLGYRTSPSAKCFYQWYPLAMVKSSPWLKVLTVNTALNASPDSV